MTHESPRQLLKRTAKEYRDRKLLLKQILEAAKPTQKGYLVPSELIEKLRQLTDAA
ncbi:MAG: hypothetical protein SFY66_19515 [Oculatellaceae cyanobacterium bins.114]|nr:hypothetical protein [Oculatellaceae cyanobacterium bins.114]